jgi:hypothetical protein
LHTSPSVGQYWVTHQQVFNFGIAKISPSTEITKFNEIRPKFRRFFFADQHMCFF